MKTAVEQSGKAADRQVPLGSAALLLCCFAALPSCLGGPRNFENENDALRSERLELQRKIADLEDQLDLRESELRALRDRHDQGAAAAPVEGATPPTIAAVRLDRYTGAVDTDRDGSDDLVRVYAQMVDARGRQLPVAGRATVQVVAIREGQPPRVVAERTYAPGEFDASYRSGFTGTHYTLELPLPSPLPDDLLGAATVQLTFTDASGARFEQQRAITLERVASAAPESAAAAP